MNIIENIKERLSIFKNLYDIIRVVDPIEKKIIMTDEYRDNIPETICYSCFSKCKSCNNCISIRSYLNDETYIKVEKIKDKSVLVIATPVIISEKNYIVELLKNIEVNDDEFEDYSNNKRFLEIIDNMNSKIIKDDLTRVYNRRYINEILPIEINNCLKYSKNLAVIMTDIDKFKHINDEYGHLAGDKIIKGFANHLSKFVCSSEDWVARYGGEEFLIILNDLPNERVYEICENIRKELEEETFEFNDFNLKITASFGISTIENFKKSNIKIDEFIKNADENLYKAKEQGRNRICY